MQKKGQKLPQVRQGRQENRSEILMLHFPLMIGIIYQMFKKH